jgi:hypothetical protein
VIGNDTAPTAYGQSNGNSLRTRNGTYQPPSQPNHKLPTATTQQQSQRINVVPPSKPIIGGQAYQQRAPGAPSQQQQQQPIKQQSVVPNGTSLIAAAMPNADTASLSNLASSLGLGVVNSDNHYERQYACQRCNFFTNNPRAILYHRKEFHLEKINVHECQYCQYASQYSGKVERHTLLRHKIDSNTSNYLK